MQIIFGTNRARDTSDMAVIITIYIVVVVVLSIDALMRESEPYRAMCRVAALVALPIVGVVLYLLDGQRRREYIGMPASPQHDIATLRERSLARVVGSRCNEPVTLCNSVTPLHNADKTYSALLRAIQRAQRSILLEYYIFIDDRLGRALCEILERKVRAGIEICIIYDDIGSWHLHRSMVRRLRRAGVDIRPFKPFRFPWFRRGVARRNHRKIAIIDSRIAFTGGINIAKRYIDGNSLGRWRDEHLRIEGDAVNRLHRLFVEDWKSCGGNPDRVSWHDGRHNIENYLPVQIVYSDEWHSRDALLDTFTAAILRAERTIRIATPYFIPPRELFNAIRIALASGVKVELMIPEHGDSRLTAAISEEYVRRITKAGAKVFRYDNGFLHSKVLIIDNRITSIGSANLDYRSLCENYEVTTLIYDRDVALGFVEQFERDKLQCCSDAPQHRGSVVYQRFTDGLLRLLSPLL